ncbi:hypothetical protein CAPTEDRAFT_180137 [Capitella teleta]|uniref:Nuclear transcription factor Y subunit gamma n=1 Tax=Capitella teleta TaxID=283909 RepID=N1PB04_CAPTE|nr:hypothetical protein CAPTEDRAFT_180137 [Capitella teleta]|eukprot:ELU18818.1 hypothetical protein CAPTEDRAFT_180137 [Capitella teleta]
MVLNNFWSSTLEEIKTLGPSEFRLQELPLARIKKIMKLDENVKMISAEAPALFARAAEIFINELTLRAWVHTEDNKRRTLQRNDIAMAISKFDQFDFLIDIVPRDELKPASSKRTEENVQRTSMMPDQVQYYFQLAQQHQQALQQQQQSVSSPTTQVVQQPMQFQLPAQQQQPQQSNNIQTITIQQPDGQQQVLQIQQAPQSQTSTTSTPAVVATQPATTPQVVTQVTNASQSSSQQQQQQTQVYTQIVSPNGELQNVPIQLTPQQIQNITLQMQGKQPGQPIVIQTQPQPGGDQSTDSSSQQLFQIPINVGGQQIFVQQAATDDDPTDVDAS